MQLTDSVFFLMLVSGLVGGFGHCAGMCGPVVATYALNISSGRTSSFSSHILYNLGRITTYSIIGGIMGFTGSFAGVVSAIERFQNIAMAGIGVIMIVIGSAISGLFSFNLTGEKTGKLFFLGNAVNRIIRLVSETHTPGSLYVIGMATGFIPCGLLYTAYLAAAGAGTGAANQTEGLLKGMLMLFLFGIGTIPALFIIGRVVALKGEMLRKKLYVLSSIFMIIIGGLFIFRSFRY